MLTHLESLLGISLDGLDSRLQAPPFRNV